MNSWNRQRHHDQYESYLKYTEQLARITKGVKYMSQVAFLQIEDAIEMMKTYVTKASQIYNKSLTTTKRTKGEGESIHDDKKKPKEVCDASYALFVKAGRVTDAICALWVDRGYACNTVWARMSSPR